MTSRCEFSLFVVVAGDLKLAGVSRFPAILWQLTLQDCERDDPRTPLGVRLKHVGTDASFMPLVSNVEYAAALEALNDLCTKYEYEGVRDYSYVDDEILGELPPLEKAVFGCPPFGSHEATTALQHIVLDRCLEHLDGLFAAADTNGHDAPVSSAPAIQFLKHVYEVACLKRTTYMSYAAVFNPKTHKVVLRLASTGGAMENLEMTTPKAYADRVVPWLLDGVYEAMLRTIRASSSVTSKNAYRVARYLRGVVTADPDAITRADIIAGRVDRFAKIRRLKLAEEHDDLRKHVMHAVQDLTNVDPVSNFEKLKAAYPKDHPDGPNAKKHFKRMQEARMQRSLDMLGPEIGEWFKGFVERGVTVAKK